MTELVIDLIVEDIAHESLFSALINRIAREEGCSARIRPRSTRGGSPAVGRELGAIRKAMQRPFGDLDLPDVLLVARDTDCGDWQDIKAAVEGVLGAAVGSSLVVATPHPYVERWMMLDGAAFDRVVGVYPGEAEYECNRTRYKRQLRDAIQAAGQVTLLDGFEFAGELIEEFDLYQAGQVDANFDRCCDDLRACLRLRQR